MTHCGLPLSPVCHFVFSNTKIISQNNFLVYAIIEKHVKIHWIDYNVKYRPLCKNDTYDVQALDLHQGELGVSNWKLMIGQSAMDTKIFCLIIFQIFWKNWLILCSIQNFQIFVRKFFRAQIFLDKN